MEKTNKAYRGVIEVVTRYWDIYGGRAALVRSPYFHLSVALTIITADSWLNGPWWLTVNSVLPNLLGFTLGGFAIFLGFGDEKFKEVIAGKSDKSKTAPSPYLSVSATFLHFVMVQIVALLWSLTAGALHFELPWPNVASVTQKIGIVGDAIGYWLFLYGITLAAAAGIAIFRVAGWYDGYQTKNRERPCAGQTDQPSQKPCSDKD